MNLRFWLGVLLIMWAATASGEPFRQVGAVGGYHSAIAIKDNVAYLCEGASLSALDLTIPDRPRQIGRLALSGLLRSITICGDKAYLTTDKFDIWDEASNSIFIVDLSDPRHLRQVGGFRIDKAIPNSIYVAPSQPGVGTLAYVLAGGITGFAVDEPSSPTLLVHAPVSYRISGIVSTGSVVYAVGKRDFDYSGLLIYQLDATTNPPTITLTNPNVYYPTGADTLILDGNRLYGYSSEAGYSPMIWDISDPLKPVLLSENGVPFPAGRKPHLYGNKLYSANSFCDVSDPKNPVVQNMNLELRGLINDLAVYGSWLYLVDAKDGLLIVDLADLSGHPKIRGLYGSPGDIGQMPISGSAIYLYGPLGVIGQMALSGSTLYLADGNGGFKTCNLSDPTSPNPLMSSFSFDYRNYVWGAYSTSSVTLHGSVAYVSGSYELEAYDISNPSNPVELDLGTKIPITATSGRNATSGNLLVCASEVTSQTIQLKIMDISIPTSPTVKSTYPLESPMTQFTIAGSQVYLLDFSSLTGSTSLKVLDLADPASPRLRGSLTISGYFPCGIQVTPDQQRAYIGTNEITVVDVSDPDHPTLLSRPSAPGTSMTMTTYQVRAFTVRDSIAYIAEGLGREDGFTDWRSDQGALQVFDMSNPQQPVLKETYPTTRTLWNVAVYGPLVCVRDTNGEIIVLHRGELSAARRAWALYE